MPAEEFRRHAHASVDWVADYLGGIRDLAVFASPSPGFLTKELPPSPPTEGESFEAMFADFQTMVVPGLTHWNHPAFYGYFANSASGPGILGEILSSALNVNAMVWKSGPSATELEDLSTDWLRQLLGLPAAFEGVINDTASSSTLYALAAARELAYPEVHEHGLYGLPPGRVYASEQTHSSVEKAVLALGMGSRGYRPIRTDADHRMDADALREALEEDAAAGIRPVAVVPTLGTTSVAAIDPVREVIGIAHEYDAWVHVDAAYGGPAAVLSSVRERFAGWEGADSIVVNPHKWLFTPMDCSVLYCARPDVLVQAFSIVPEYLKTKEGAETRSLMDYGISLGRRLRALKLWFVIRYFGRVGLARRIEEHLRLARLFAGWVESESEWEVVAPVELGLVAFRHSGGDDKNREIMDRVNGTGEAFLTHTAVDGQIALRLSIGNVKTEERDVARVWRILRDSA